MDVMPSFLIIANLAESCCPQDLSYASVDALTLDDAWKITIENLTQIDPYLGIQYEWIEKRFGLAEGELPQLTATQWEEYMKDYNSEVNILPIAERIRIPGEKDCSKEWVLVGWPDDLQTLSSLDFRVMHASSFTSLTHHLFKFLDTEDNATQSTHSQDAFKIGARKTIVKAGISTRDMATMSINQFNQQQWDLRVDGSTTYGLWVGELHHVIPRTPSQINAEREAARAAEFNNTARLQPGGVYILSCFTKDLPALINCNPSSSGEDLAAAFHRVLYQHLASIVQNPESIRVISVKRNRCDETECTFQVDGYCDGDKDRKRLIFDRLRGSPLRLQFRGPMRRRKFEN